MVPAKKLPETHSKTMAQKVVIPPTFSNFEEIAEDPFKYILIYLERRLLNLEKRKERLDGYQKMIDEGVTLVQNKKTAVAKREEVGGSITFANEIITLFNAVSRKVVKIQKQTQKRENGSRAQKELKRSEFIVKSLAIFNLIAQKKEIQQDFLEGKNNAMQLEQEEVDLLVKFAEDCVHINHNTRDNVLSRSEKSGQHLNHLFNRSEVSICGSSYDMIAAIFDKVCESTYFSDLPDFTEKANSKSEDETQQNEDLESSSDEEEGEFREEPADIIKKGIEFSSSNIDRVPPTSASVSELDTNGSSDVPSDQLQEYSKFPNMEQTAPPPSNSAAYDELQTIVGQVTDPQLQQMQMSFMSFEVDDQPQEPVMKEEPKRRAPATVEEVLAEVQGEYNFLQESMLNDAGDKELPYSGTAVSAVSNLPLVAAQQSDLHSANQYNSTGGNQSVNTDSSFLQNGPSMAPANIAPSHLHHAHAPNSLYPPIYQEKSDTFTDAKLQDIPVPKKPGDDLGMGQTTFGANESSYSVDLPVSTQYGGSLHSVDAYQTKSSDIALMKTLPENSYSASPFNTLHGNSQSPFEGSLSGNKIPDPIPLPSGSSLAQTLDPPTAHIPFPNDKLSGYRSYSGTSPTMDGAAEEDNSQFVKLQEKPSQTSLLSAGDAVHISSSSLKLDSNSVDPVNEEVLKVDENLDVISTNQMHEDKAMTTAANSQMNRGGRGAGGYQNSSNYNRGNAVARQGQNQAMGGFYQNRSGNNYRPAHNRNFGNFDSMGHPKNFGGSGGVYPHPQAGGVPSFNHYNRQDNGIYGGMQQRRGTGGSGRGNRGYPSRMNNIRNAGPNTSHNRSRTFRPQNSEHMA